MNPRAFLSLILLLLLFVLVGVGIHNNKSENPASKAQSQKINEPTINKTTPIQPKEQTPKKATNNTAAEIPTNFKEKIALYIKEHPLKFGVLTALLFVFLGVMLTYFYFGRI